jgi:S-formylglutathione hydrolase FrmB
LVEASRVTTKSEVVSRHGARLDWVTFPSQALGVSRTFGLYLPPGYDPAKRRYPVLYLFRGHHDEWAGSQDGREGLVPLLGRLIRRGRIEPLVAVLPGLMPDDRKSQGAPVNWSASGERRGVGTARFEDHFFELKNFVESHLPVRVGKGSCALDGFSMGGYSAVLLGTRYPHLFGSVGAYDGSFMWRRQVDPRRRRHHPPDPLWFSESCAPLFRRGRRFDIAKMERYNPVWLAARAGGRKLVELRRTRFHVRTVAGEKYGNFDRALHVLDVLLHRGVKNSFSGRDVALDPDARHDWRWADIHLEGTLPLHDAVFRESG